MRTDDGFLGQNLYGFVEDEAEKLAKKLYRKIKTVPRDRGYFCMVVGSSCSGKSLTLVKLSRLLSESKNDKHPYVFCQPLVDRRDLINGVIRSRNNQRIDATSFDSKEEIEKIFHDNDFVGPSDIVTYEPRCADCLIIKK